MEVGTKVKRIPPSIKPLKRGVGETAPVKKKRKSPPKRRTTKTPKEQRANSKPSKEFLKEAVSQAVPAPRVGEMIRDPATGQIQKGSGGGKSPIVLSDEQIIEVGALASVLTVVQIADYLGIGRTTFNSILNRQSAVRERYLKGRAVAVGRVAKGLLQSCKDGDVQAMKFYLGTQAGWNATAHLNLTSSDGSMSPKSTQLTTEELEEQLKQRGISPTYLIEQ